MKFVSIIGARPQFIKAAAVSREISKYTDIQEVIVHTGQHFDINMSEIFFKQMQIPEPDYNLGINSLTHGAMTGQMLTKIEEVLIKEKPDWVLVYGDTNSTLAGSLAAKKLLIKTAHIEAGLRSYNMKMPEEVNRILTDRISDVLFCPSNIAVENLENKGFKDSNCKVINSGDVMLDSALFYEKISKKPKFAIPDKFILSTIHRAENTDDPQKLKSIFAALSEISQKTPIVLPLHPRTKKIIEDLKTCPAFDGFKTWAPGRIENLILVEPVGYLEMIYLLKKCSIVMTDSGGLQKEAYFFKKPCITLRNETEWVELIEHGFNIVAGIEEKGILRSYEIIKKRKSNFNVQLFGDGKASTIIIKELLNN
ncbi:MAG: UDP-N-acetylglucosamine 2-epimerase (non-hydrolyzing) [Candidatus Cloacimonetes bacterium]|nr:UDP-N-acetylglucosamine 2-epimerase (non-hydrolyzing) [Candidatus Cloacimonadota bacterium]